MQFRTTHQRQKSQADGRTVSGHDIRSTEMARLLGVHPRTIRRAYKRGALPGAKEHGPRILMIPHRLVIMACTYGLRVVEYRARAGMI
jgi:hypothetical protein